MGRLDWMYYLHGGVAGFCLWCHCSLFGGLFSLCGPLASFDPVFAAQLERFLAFPYRIVGL